MRSIIVLMTAVISIATESVALFARQDSNAIEPIICRLVRTEENVVASELLGEWILDGEISRRIDSQHSLTDRGPVVFRESKESAVRIIAYLNTTIREVVESDPEEEVLESMRSIQLVYLAGEVEWNGEKQDFALTSVYGTPRIMLFDREDDLESQNVMLARDDEGENDLLFLGGDFNNQSFRAYKRVPKN